MYGLPRQAVWAGLVDRNIIETTERIRTVPWAWTERLGIGRWAHQVQISGDDGWKGYSAPSRELAWALDQGQRPEKALERHRASVERVLAFQARECATGTGGRTVH